MEGVAVFTHEFTAGLNLLVEGGVIGRDGIAVWCFHEKHRLPFFKLEPPQDFARQNNANGIANLSQFESVHVSALVITYVILNQTNPLRQSNVEFFNSSLKRYPIHSWSFPPIKGYSPK